MPSVSSARSDVGDESKRRVWGNHDFNYHRVPPFFSSGYQFGLEEPYQQLFEDHQDRFKAAYAVDGWLCTHAGLTGWVAKDITDVHVLADMVNDHLAKWLAKTDQEYSPTLKRPAPRCGADLFFGAKLTGRFATASTQNSRLFTAP